MDENEESDYELCVVYCMYTRIERDCEGGDESITKVQIPSNLGRYETGNYACSLYPKQKSYVNLSTAAAACCKSPCVWR